MVDRFDEVIVNFTVRVCQMNVPRMKNELGFYLVSGFYRNQWIDIDKVEIFSECGRRGTRSVRRFGE